MVKPTAKFRIDHTVNRENSMTTETAIERWTWACHTPDVSLLERPNGTIYCLADSKVGGRERARERQRDRDRDRQRDRDRDRDRDRQRDRQRDRHTDTESLCLCVSV